MCDVRYCKGLPKGMRDAAALFLGMNSVESNGEPYADVQRPSFSYESNSYVSENGYAAHSGERPRGTVLA